ncbi:MULTISPECIES: hypothetical protein [Bacillus]|nr:MULTISPECIES: hypothetical protein [Bacillus]
MTSGEIVNVIAYATYFGFYGSLLFIPYGLIRYFSNERKKELANKLITK